MSGCTAKSFLKRVPLPTPEGPEMMRGRRSGGRVGAMVMVVVERLRKGEKVEALA